MARSTAQALVSRTSRRVPNPAIPPLPDPNPYNPSAPLSANGAERYAFLDQKHCIYDAWIDRWELNEARLAGGDDVIDELRPFSYETDLTEEGQYASRKREAIYTNFADIYATVITGHLIRFAPRPDQGWSVPNLGAVRGRSRTPTQGEQVWYSVDNPAGSGHEWNQWWMDETRRAMATGHRWIYVDTPGEPALTQARQQQGFRPYACSFSPIDTYNWFFNDREVLEFVVFRLPQDGGKVVNGQFQQNRGQASRGYLLCVREGCERLGEEFVGGGWWKFDGMKNIIDEYTWDDTDGEIPVDVLYYQRHKGTKNYPAMSRPAITELGQAAVAHMNLMSSANFDAWDAGGSVDYLAGVDEDAFEEVQRLEKLGSKRIPLPPNSDTDAVPQVFNSAVGKASSETFSAREESIWNNVVRLGIIEASGQVNGATAEAQFSAAVGPRIVWVATNLSVCQNNIIRYFELRFGHNKPTGMVQWPSRYDLVELIDRIRGFFEIQRLAGIRSKTASSIAMTQAAEDKGLIVSPDDRDKILKEYEDSADTALQADALAANPPAPAGGGLGKPVGAKGAKKQADRLALQKGTRTRGKPGTNSGKGPKQTPVVKSAPGVKR